MDVQKIHDVMKTMSYGENLEDTSTANQWLQTLEIVDKSSEIDNILKNLKGNGPALEKGHLRRWCQELEKNANVIAQIEILSRGILSKDTKKAVESLVQFFYYYASSVAKTSSGEIVVGIFDDDHPLWIVGLFLGPALAAGRTVVLQTGTKFAAVVTYILELAVKAGIPKGALNLVPSNEGDLQPYLSNENVVIVTLFVDLLNEKYRGINAFHKKILVFSANKTPMLVFDNADLDSAVESAIESAWGYQGMLPWSTNTILIQENVFTSFTDKLKTKLASVRIGNGNDKLADIAYPSNPNVFQRLMRTVNKAKKLGIDVFQKESAGNNYAPTLIIGSRVDTNNVLTATENDSTVTLLAFRSIDEAVSLANNTRQGLGASVWSENIGLVNEIARKLQVGNVWINCHGLFSPHLPLVPFKDSGTGYFGGEQGQEEYRTFVKSHQPTTDITCFKQVEAVANAISSATKAAASWAKSPVLNRMRAFQQLGDYIETNGKKLGEKIPEKWLDRFNSDLESVVFESRDIGTSTQDGYSVSSLKSPRGVLGLEMRNPVETHPVNLLLAALFEGNAVVLLNESSEMLLFYQEVSKKLPTGLLTVLPYSVESVLTCSKHKELSGFLLTQPSSLGSLPLSDSKRFALVPKNLEWKQVFNYVRLLKLVWSNIGQSSQCNL